MVTRVATKLVSDLAIQLAVKENNTAVVTIGLPVK